LNTGWGHANIFEGSFKFKTELKKKKKKKSFMADASVFHGLYTMILEKYGAHTQGGKTHLFRRPTFFYSESKTYKCNTMMMTERCRNLHKPDVSYMIISF